MILDKLYNAHNYINLHPLFGKVFEFVEGYL